MIIKILGGTSLGLLFFGFLLKEYSITGANSLQIFGLFIFVVGFSPLFLKNKLAEETRKGAKFSYAALLITSILMMMSAQFTILKLYGAHELTLFSLILFMIYIVFFSQPQEGRKLRIRKDRQLAAIVFTDIVGYTALMGKDEDKGLQILDQNRKIHKKWIARFRGNFLKEMGDGNIAIFYTATEALLCGLEIQKEVKTSFSFSLRMGIHISEIVFTDTDAFGDGMNIASRISNQAKSGEICFSDSVYNNIRNREDIAIELMGTIPLKNVEYDIPLYRIVT